MKYTYTAENTTVTDAIKNYAETKLSVLDKFEAVTDANAKVNVKVYPDKLTKAEVTIKDFHAEAKDYDLYAAIDFVVEKLDKQLRKAKTKRLNFRQDRSALKHSFGTN